jgi:hypothetical protein
MNCPLCSTTTNSLGVRTVATGRRRRRICPNCGHRMFTIEVIDRPPAIRGLLNSFSADGPSEALETRCEQRGLWMLLKENPPHKQAKAASEDGRQTRLPLEPPPGDPDPQCDLCGAGMIRIEGGWICTRAHPLPLMPGLTI